MEQDAIFSVLKFFPIPIEVFSLDGISLFVNTVFWETFGIPATVEFIGKFNILQDPYINNKLKLTDYLKSVFSGEILSIRDMRIPFEKIYARYMPEKYGQPVGKDIYQDITCFPIWDKNGSIAYVAALFITKNIYQTRNDVIKAKEYIDAHWLEDFNLDEIAQTVNLSRHHLTRLFKRYIGRTLYSYYQDVKLQKIKEAVLDTNLSISEAFASCGVDYCGGIAESFRKKFGMPPSQYRKEVTDHPNAEQQDTSISHFPEYSVWLTQETEEILFQVMELLPIPIQIFKSNGDIIFVNEAVLKMWNVLDTRQIIGKYNLLTDPLVNEQFGLKDDILRAFRGEVVLISDIRVPLESFWEWYKKRSDSYDIESIYTDILNFPVFSEDGKVMHIISVFLTSRIYQGNSDVIKAKEYLENHWREKFDIEKTAEVVHLRPSQLTCIFKKHTGMTPFSYYQELKVNKLKEALRDKNLSITEACESCGIEYHGNFAKLFKERVGMTPSLYQRTIGK